MITLSLLVYDPSGSLEKRIDSYLGLIRVGEDCSDGKSFVQNTS